MTREFGEGERHERPKEKTDELEELRSRINERYGESGREGDEARSRVSDDDSDGPPPKKDSAEPEESAEGLGEHSAKNHAERLDEENEIKEGAESAGDAGQERDEPDEFGSYVEHLKARYESDGDGEAEWTLGPEQKDRAQGELDVGAYERAENDERLEQQSATSETKREGVSGPPERADDSAEATDPARVGESPLGGVRVSQAGAEERARETETVAGRVETPRPHEGAALKTDEESLRSEGGVAGNAEPRQAYLERSAAPASRLDEPEVSAERKEAPKVEPAEGLGVFSATALRRTDDSTAFEVRLDSLQKAGVTFETGKTYEIKGRIGEVCDFRKMYSPGESDRTAILAPKEYARLITPGEKYDVRIGSVREISRNEEHLGVFSATAYRIPGSEDRFRFDLLVSSFEKRTGVRFEEGKMYEVRGRIGDVCDFKVTRTAERSQHLFVFAPREYTRDLVPGQKYNLTVESVREKMECHVTEGTRGFPRLILQKRALEAAGLRLDGADREGKIVVEVNLKGSEGVTHRLFAKVEPKESVMVMSMDRIGAKVGDVFDLQRARVYYDGVFVEDFNKYGSRELSNVRLQLERKKLSMIVDDARFEVSEYNLDAHRTQALLRCNLEPFQREIRFLFDGKEVTAKFGGSWTIESLRANNDRLEMKYSMSGRLLTARSDASLLKENRLEVPEVIQSVKLLEYKEEIEGMHRFLLESPVYERVYERLTAAINISQGNYFGERGELGENIGVAVLYRLGWEVVARHPFSEYGPGPETHKHGTDVLMRNKRGELFLFEIRWWDNTSAALDSGKEEVMKRAPDEKSRGEWGQIRGAYIVGINLRMKSKVAELHIERVW